MAVLGYGGPESRNISGIVVARLLYAISALEAHLNVAQSSRINTFLTRACKCGFSGELFTDSRTVVIQFSQRFFSVTRAKQAQACNTATCLRISDIFTYLFRYLLIHTITY